MFLKENLEMISPRISGVLFASASMLMSTVFLANVSHAAKCTYEIDNPTMQWTGYKFTEKVGVKGSFDNIDFVQKKSPSVDALFKSIEFNVDTASVNSNNISRDKKLALYVFGNLAGPGSIRGKVTSFDMKGKTATTELQIGSKKHSIKFTVSEKGGKYTLNGILKESDILKLDLKDSFDRIHQACKELHIGKDGKSVTWKEVGLEINTGVSKKCS